MSDSTTTISELRTIINEFRARRGWGKEDPKDMALSLVLESAELLEHFQWLTGQEVLENEKIRKAIGEEMSDVLWWLANLSDRLGIDMTDAFLEKVKKNAIKYPETLFSPSVSEEERMRQYYKIKAATRGGHPLYNPDDDEDEPVVHWNQQSAKQNGDEE